MDRFKNDDGSYHLRSCIMCGVDGHMLVWQRHPTGRAGRGNCATNVRRSQDTPWGKHHRSLTMITPVVTQRNTLRDDLHQATLMSYSASDGKSQPARFIGPCQRLEVAAQITISTQFLFDHATWQIEHSSKRFDSPVCAN